MLLRARGGCHTAQPSHTLLPSQVEPLGGRLESRTCDSEKKAGEQYTSCMNQRDRLASARGQYVALSIHAKMSHCIPNDGTSLPFGTSFSAYLRLLTLQKRRMRVADRLTKVGEWLSKVGAPPAKVHGPHSKVHEWLSKVGERLRKVRPRPTKVRRHHRKVCGSHRVVRACEQEFYSGYTRR